MADKANYIINDALMNRAMIVDMVGRNLNNTIDNILIDSDREVARIIRNGGNPKAVLNRIQRRIDKAYTMAHQLVRTELTDFIGDQVDFDKAVLNEAVGKTLKVNTPTKTSIRRAVVDTKLAVGGKRYRNLLGYTNQLSKRDFREIKRRLQAGVLKGLSANQVADTIFRNAKLASPTRLSRAQLKAVARTFMTSASSMSTFNTMKMNPDVITGYRYIATLDSRTSNVCINHDGKRYPVEEGHPMPPLHMNCRSVIVPIVGKYDDMPNSAFKKAKSALDPSQRASLDGSVPATTNYSTWLRGQPGATQIKILGKDLAEEYRENPSLDIKRLLNQRGRRINLSTARSLSAAASRGISARIVTRTGGNVNDFNTTTVMTTSGEIRRNTDEIITMLEARAGTGSAFGRTNRLPTRGVKAQAPITTYVDDVTGETVFVNDFPFDHEALRVARRRLRRHGPKGLKNLTNTEINWVLDTVAKASLESNQKTAAIFALRDLLLASKKAPIVKFNNLLVKNLNTQGSLVAKNLASRHSDRVKRAKLPELLDARTRNKRLRSLDKTLNKLGVEQELQNRVAIVKNQYGDILKELSDEQIARLTFGASIDGIDKSIQQTALRLGSQTLRAAGIDISTINLPVLVRVADGASDRVIATATAKARSVAEVTYQQQLGASLLEASAADGGKFTTFVKVQRIRDAEYRRPDKDVGVNEVPDTSSPYKDVETLVLIPNDEYIDEWYRLNRERKRALNLPQQKSGISTAAAGEVIDKDGRRFISSDADVDTRTVIDVDESNFINETSNQQYTINQDQAWVMNQISTEEGFMGYLVKNNQAKKPWKAGELPTLTAQFEDSVAIWNDIANNNKTVSFQAFLDYRTRVYLRGYPTQPNGTDIDKSMYQFKKGAKLIDESGLPESWPRSSVEANEQIMAFGGGSEAIGLKTSYDIGKSTLDTFEGRMLIWSRNRDKMLEIGEAVLNRDKDIWIKHGAYLLKTKKPTQVLAMGTELARNARYLKSNPGKKLTSRTSYYGAAQDATASGPQLNGVLFNVDELLRKTNIRKGARKQSLYENTGRLMMDLPFVTQNPVLRQITIEQWVAISKHPTMTSLYRVTERGISGQIRVALREILSENPDLAALNIGKELKLLSNNNLKLMAEAMTKAIDEDNPAFGAILRYFELRGTASAKEGGKVGWNNPFFKGNRREYAIRQTSKVKTEVEAFGRKLELDTLVVSDDISISQTANKLPPNETHGIDASLMMVTRSRTTKQGIEMTSNHDSITTPIGDFKVTNDIVKESLNELHQSNYIRNQLDYDLKNKLITQKDYDIITKALNDGIDVDGKITNINPAKGSKAPLFNFDETDSYYFYS